jgi:hypothetical protein
MDVGSPETLSDPIISLSGCWWTGYDRQVITVGVGGQVMLVRELNASAKIGVFTSVMEPQPTIHDQLKLYMRPYITKSHVLAGVPLYYTLYYTLNNN